MCFILDSWNVNQAEVLEPSLQSDDGDGKTEVSTESEVYDIDQILSFQNESNLSDYQKYLILNKHFRPLNDQMKYLQVLHVCVRVCVCVYVHLL